MNGMLSRASGNSPPLLNVQILQLRAAPVQGQKRHGGSSSNNSNSHSSKSQQSGRSIECHRHQQQQQQAEPNSVLDIRSPSPSSTLSSSLGGSSESGAVAGLFCEAVSDGHGQLPDPNVSNANNAWHSDNDGARRLQPQRAVSLSRKSKWGGEGSTWKPNNNNGEGSGIITQDGNESRSGAGECEAKGQAAAAAAAVAVGAAGAEAQTQRAAATDEWGSDLQALSGNAGNEFQMMTDKLVIDDLESMLFESASPPTDHSLMRWLRGEIEEPLQHKDASSSTQIKTGSADGMDSHFSAGIYTDSGAFSFPTSLVDAVGPATPSMPSPPYPTLPTFPKLPPGLSSNPRLHSHSHSFDGSSSRGLGLEAGSLTFVPNVPCFQPEPVFPPPGVYGSNPPQLPFNPFKMSADPAAAAPPAPPQNSIFFPVSYAQQLQTGSDAVVPPPPPPLPPPPPPLPKRHHGLPELLQKPLSLSWQQQYQQQELQVGWQPFLLGGGGGLHADPAPVVKAEQPDVLVPLQSRLPQYQRQRGIINSNKVGSDEVQLTMVEQLLKAAEAVEIGNLGFAQAILARLNQHLSPLGKPLHRAAFYFKEALSSRLLLHNSNNNSPNTNASALSPLDIVHKISAYKSFSEFSPLTQFANFTANQALLESLKGAQAIHIIDFEIGLGGQWASFLQEIALQIGGPPAFRLTAVGSNDSMEMHLTRENLCHFAKELNVSFEFSVVEVEQLECVTPAMLQLREREAIAINFSLGMHRFLSTFSPAESIISLFRLLKQLSPKAIVVVDNESERNGVSFVQQFLEALQFYSFLFDSLDASNMNMEAIHKIEKFLMAPKIHNVVAAKRRSAAPGEKAPPWRNLFIDAGFSPMPFSNITETQAEYLIAKMQGRGFEVSKTHGSLLLVWQGRPLVAASVWRC